MKKLLVLTLTAFCCVVLVFGHLHWIKINKAVAIEGQVMKEELRKKGIARKEALIKELDPKNNPMQSIMDFLHYRALTQEKVKITFLGSSVTAGVGASNSSYRWTEIIKKKLLSENEVFQSLKVINSGYEGYTTTDLLNAKKIDLIVLDQPDVVIFENALINNYFQGIPIQQTLEDLENIMDQLTKRLPHSGIIIMSPNPIVNNNPNNLGLKYVDYITETEKYITDKKWPYINSYQEIEKTIKAENILMVDLFSENYNFPNDKGNYVWSEVLYAQFKKNKLKMLASKKS